MKNSGDGVQNLDTHFVVVVVLSPPLVERVINLRQPDKKNSKVLSLLFPNPPPLVKEDAGVWLKGKTIRKYTSTYHLYTIHLNTMECSRRKERESVV